MPERDIWQDPLTIRQHTGMARQQTLVHLTDDLVAALEDRAARLKVSRSHVIRVAVEEYLRTDREAEIDAAIIDGYTRIPPEPDPWAEAAARESIRRDAW
jgi:predicted transcriptional regulator